ncbi:hypothetical protein FZEAL_1435 [Fusarium zealandicum]|uniref:Uncharacterized protein n=1 Tax=Fusarium zealandicum TaxID=1053134 RepID=A0A8H4UT90_9HYPO|nr:hypothetical protein FZEAL_1435 [Fusarium zealandicum]
MIGVFVKSRQAADNMDEFLYNTKLSVTSIYSGHTNQELEGARRPFRYSNATILITTNTSAQEIDHLPKCHHYEDKRWDIESIFFGIENALGFGVVPTHPSSLSQVERIPCYNFHYRGQQRRYRGHIINPLKNIGSVYSFHCCYPEPIIINRLKP